MILKNNFLKVFFFLNIFSNFVKSEEESSLKISDEIEQLKKDLKTLEKAVYKTSQISNLHHLLLIV